MPLLDWIVVVGYLAIVAAIGVVASRRHDRADAFFLAGRSIPAWAASFSVVATVLSAATFVGMPQQAYRGDLTYMVFKFAGLPALIVVGILFLPAFYRSTHASIYGDRSRAVRLREPAPRPAIELPGRAGCSRAAPVCSWPRSRCRGSCSARRTRGRWR